MKPKALLFDFGGTLMDDTFDVRAGNEHVYSLIEGNSVSAEEWARVAKMIDSEITAIRALGGLEHAGTCFARLLRDCLGVECPFTVEDEETLFWNASETWVPVAGAIEVVRQLSASEVKLGILSNMTFRSHLIRSELEKIGIHGCFDAVVTSADYGVRKPHPLVFRALAGRLGVQCDECWYIGDTLEVDIAGAKAAGMTAVWLNRDAKEPSHENEPDISITGWPDFDEIWEW